MEIRGRLALTSCDAGTVPTERHVVFPTVQNGRIALSSIWVDCSRVVDGKLDVQVIREEKEQTLIQVPDATGSQHFVPNVVLEIYYLTMKGMR